jgi:hypothetical protein
MHVVKLERIAMQPWWKRVARLAQCVIGVQVVATSTYQKPVISFLAQRRNQNRKHHSCKIRLITLCVFYRPILPSVDTLCYLPPKADNDTM